MVTYHEDLVSFASVPRSPGTAPVCSQQHQQQHCGPPGLHAAIRLPAAIRASYPCCGPVPPPRSSLRGNLEQAMERHRSIRSRLGSPPTALAGLPAPSLRPPAPKPGVIDFIRCINPVSRAQEASLIADALSEPGPGGLQEPPIPQQVGELQLITSSPNLENKSIEEILSRRSRHYVLEQREGGKSHRVRVSRDDPAWSLS